MFAVFDDPAVWLPFTFAALMGLSILIYVILDGFDLGIGLLFPFADDAERDRMISAIGPFWDANETWLVLAVGLLLVAFPMAHGTILTALYLPVAVMLIGLILRGVAFEFRVKAPKRFKRFWDGSFLVGSTLTSLSQGFMLGMYVMGLNWTLPHVLFATGTALFLAVGYSFIGATWLIYKTTGSLQAKALAWAKGGIWGLILGIGAISAATPLVSARIFDRWFDFPRFLWLAPLPIVAGLLILWLWVMLRRMPFAGDRWSFAPFLVSVGLWIVAFVGMAYSFYPYVVPDQMTIYEAASARESLAFMLVGAIIVLPAILAYTVLSYTVFRGKATDLRYD